MPNGLIMLFIFRFVVWINGCGSVAYWFRYLLGKQKVAGLIPAGDTDTFGFTSGKQSGVKLYKSKVTNEANKSIL